jgi:hypothetical protein
VTDQNGVAFYTGLPVGTFDVHVKGNHSLQTARASVALAANTTATVDMKAQVEGDIDGDNCVTVDDLSIVQSMLGAYTGVPGFNSAADLNGDGIVTMADMSLLRSGFDMCGDISADNSYRTMTTEGAPSLSQVLALWTNPASLQHNLQFELVAGANSVRVGQLIDVYVVANTGTQPIDGASFIVRFDPKAFTVVDSAGRPAKSLEPGLTLPSVMGNWIDSVGGAVGYSAGIVQGTLPQGRFTVAKIRLHASAMPSGGQTQISFAPIGSGHVQLTNGGTNLLAKTSDLTIKVMP